MLQTVRSPTGDTRVKHKKTQSSWVVVPFYACLVACFEASPKRKGARQNSLLYGVNAVRLSKVIANHKGHKTSHLC